MWDKILKEVHIETANYLIYSIIVAIQITGQN